MGVKVNHYRATFNYATSSTSAMTATIPAEGEGWAKIMSWEMPATCAATSGTVTVADSRPVTVYVGTSNVLSCGQTSRATGLNIPIMPGGYVKLDLNTIPGSTAGSATPASAYIDFYMSV